MRRILFASLAVVGIACADSITIPYTQSVGLVGAWGLTSVNDKPVPSKDTGNYVGTYRYVIDSGRIVLGDSLFTDYLYYTLVNGDSVFALGDTVTGQYFVLGNTVRFHALAGYVYNAAYLNGSLVEVWGDGHTLVYVKR